jgi:hypothetical protein
MYCEGSEDPEATLPNLKKQALIPGVGHLVQQGRPDEMNELLIEPFSDL